MKAMRTEKKKMQTSSQSKIKRIIAIVVMVLILCSLIGIILYKTSAPQLTTIDNEDSPLASAEEIKSQLETMSDTLDTMGSTLDTNIVEIENLQTSITESSEIIDYSFTTVNEDIDVILNKMTSDLDNISKQLATTKTDLETLITEINNGQTADMQSKFEAIQAKLGELSSQLDTMSKDNKDNYDKINIQLTKFQEELNEYLEDPNKETQELITKNFNDLNTKIDGVLSSLTINLESISSEITLSTETITNIIESTSDSMPAYLEEQFSLLTTHVDNVDSNVITLNELTTTQHTEITEQVSSFETAVTEQLDNFETVLNGTISAEFRTVNTNIDESLDSINTDMSDLSGKIDTTRNEIVTLINQINENNLDNLEEKFEAVQTHLNEITDHFNTTLDDISDAISDLSTQNRTEHEETISKLTSVQSDLTDLHNTTKTELQTALTNMQESYEQSLDDLQDSIDQSFEDIETNITNNNNEINNKLDDVNTDITETISNSFNTQTNEINNNFSDVNDILVTQNQNIINNFDSVNNQLTTNYNNLSQQEQESRDEIANLINQYQQAVSDYNTQAENSFQNVVKIKSDIASALNDKGSVRADGQRWDGSETWEELAEGIVNLQLEVHIPVDPKYCVLQRQVRGRIEPTCTEDGGYHDVQYCLTCKADAMDTWVKIPRTGHNLKTITVAPTCTANGYTRHYCTNINPRTGKQCTYYYDDQIVSKLGHNPMAYVNETVTEPTCTLTGIHNEVVYCSRCHAKLSSIQRVTPALGHNYVSKVVQPTCTSDGYTTHICSRCSTAAANTDYTTKLGHNAVYVGTAGIHTKCSRCNVTLSTTHSYTSTVKINATCTSKGTHTYTCACGYHYDSQDIPIAGHSYTQTATEYLNYPTIQMYLSCYAGDASGPAGTGAWHYGNLDAGTAVEIYGKGTWYLDATTWQIKGNWFGSPAWITIHRMPGTSNQYMNEVDNFTDLSTGVNSNGTFRLYKIHDVCGVCGHWKD